MPGQITRALSGRCSYRHGIQRYLWVTDFMSIRRTAPRGDVDGGSVVALWKQATHYAAAEESH
jgi:hypothetical protein